MQNIAEFERLVDGLFIKKNCDVCATGSNAMLLSGELATLLTGRDLELNMYPFSFSEYTDKNKAELEQSNNPPKLTKTESLAEFLYSLITMDADHEPVYDVIRKIKATDWLLTV